MSAATTPNLSLERTSTGMAPRDSQVYHSPCNATPGAAAQLKRQKSTVRLVTSLLLSLIWATGSVAYECPVYSDHEWEFVGHIVTQTYPGPPNYESISGGDKPLTRWYLQLPRAVCINNYHHQFLFQLTLKPEDFERYRQFLGKEIRIKGTLEEAVAGNHRTPLILNISSLVRLGVDRS